MAELLVVDELLLEVVGPVADLLVVAVAFGITDSARIRDTDGACKKYRSATVIRMRYD